jgi:FSR family fosmidomycin resistance protein-like MFS transporter
MAIFAVGGNLGFALGPIIAIYIIKYMGFSSLPVIVVPSVVFLAVIIFYWRDISITEIKKDRAADGKVQRERRKGAYISLSMVIAIVVMRSWTQMGLMSYIPFYYINHLKGDPLYAGKLVFVLLLGGVIGTLGGAPLADKWGHKRYLQLSMFLSTLILPLIFITDGYMLFAVLGFLGMTLISTFSVTVVMAQQLLPKNLGVASGLMVGFAIGAGGICVTLLGVIADHFGVPVALKSIMVLPFAGFLLSAILRYPEDSKTRITAEPSPIP